MPVQPDQETVTVEMIEALYLDRYSRFLAVAQGILGDRERAHDAVQETFARAIASRERLHASTLSGWLWRVLTNLCLSDRRFHPLPGTPDLEPAQPTTDEPFTSPDLAATLTALPPRQRHVLFLRHYADLDYEAIAELLGIARGTVAATLNAAHARLRTTLTLEHKE